MEPAVNGEPSTLPLTLDEIKYVNNTRAFKSGSLEFPSDIEEDVYSELRIDTSKLLKLSEIRKILLEPTKDGLIKIISITSLSDFDRVRGQFQKLKSEGYKLTLDIADIIERRTKELFNNQVKTSIQIGDADTSTSIENARVAELERQIEAMKSLIEKSISNPSANEDKDVSVTETKSEEKEVIKKSPGRPKKSSI